MSDVTVDNYFELRRVGPDSYENYELPAYLTRRLPEDKSVLVIDFGCGFGQMIRALRKLGYTNLVGIEINEQAILYCLSDGIKVFRSIEELGSIQAEFVIMNHVLEHLPKPAMREVLSCIKDHMRSGGRLLVCVPNAQSATGAYWAYEDFTHEYLFTTGSLYYITKLVGFSEAIFIDIDCTEGLGFLKKSIRKTLLWLYRSRMRFWNKATASHYHSSSEEIFSYELKVLCRRE